METIEQVNDDFNVKKPKKKGLIIAGVVVAVIIVALLLVYFLIFAKPQYVFDKAIDDVFDFEEKDYNSIKVDTKTKVSIEAEDSSMQSQLEEIEKCTVKFGAQMDLDNKQEIVNAGLEYDNDSVVSAQVYYNNGDMYAYFDELFDKYIQIDMEEEQKEELEAIFDTANSDGKKENANKAMEIAKKELKKQLKEEGEFEKGKETIDIGDDEKRVTKSTLTLTQKQLYKVISNMCSNLASDDEFLDCFEESPKDSLKDFADEIKDAETSNENKVEISIYSKAFKNIGLDIVVHTEDQSITVSIIKEDEGLYFYNVSVKEDSQKVDAIKGKVEIAKDKDSKDEQSGKLTITAEVVETGTAKLEIDYSVKYNDGIDKIDTSNSINMNDLTEEDMQDIVNKLKERPLIGDLIEERLSSSNSVLNEDYITDGNDSFQTETTTTSQNEVKNENYGYSVTYSVPTGFNYESNYSYDYSKSYSLGDYNSESQMDATVSLKWNTDEDYKDDIDWDYNYYNDETDSYKNVNLGELKTVKVGDKEFKYQILTYEENSEYSDEKYENAYIWYNLDDEYIFCVELEATDTTITEDTIKGFLNINISEI